MKEKVHEIIPIYSDSYNLKKISCSGAIKETSERIDLSGFIILHVLHNAAHAYSLDVSFRYSL